MRTDVQLSLGGLRLVERSCHHHRKSIKRLDRPRPSAAGLTPVRCCICRWVYRNPFSILDPNAVDAGMGSKNGTVNSVLSRVPRTHQPRLRYCHMATMSHLPNGSIAAQWQVCSERDTVSALKQWFV